LIAKDDNNIAAVQIKLNFQFLPLVYTAHWFYYAWKQLLLSARLSHHNSVCLFVRPSYWWIRQKWSKL